MNKQARVVVIVVSVIIALSLIVLFLNSLGHKGKVRVELVVAPTDSVVTVDGKITKGSVVYLSPGVHTFKIGRIDFDTYETKQNISSNPEVLLSPTASTDAARGYLAKNPDQQQKIEQIGGKYQNIVNTTTDNKYPYLSSLPIETSNFIISQGVPINSVKNNGGFTAAIYIKALNPIDRTRAVERIRTELGIDPTTIEIYFEDAPVTFWEKGE